MSKLLTTRITQKYLYDQRDMLGILNRYLRILRAQLKTVIDLGIGPARYKEEFYLRYRIKTATKIRNRHRARLRRLEKRLGQM